jgi:YVTN family beta-propeller protein
MRPEPDAAYTAPMTTTKKWYLAAGVAVAATVAFVLARSRTPTQRPGTLYVSSEASGTVTAIDLGTNQVIATISAGKRPRGVQVSPDGKTVYVALSGSPNMGPGLGEHEGPPADKSADGIGVIDVATNKLVRKLPAGSDPEQFAVSHDSTRLYVANEDTAELSVVDAQKGDVVKAIAVGTEPEGVAMSPDGTMAFVTSETNNRIDVVDTRSNTVLGTVAVGTRPRALAVSKDGRRAIVTLEDAAAVALIDPILRKVVKTVTLPGDHVRPMGVVLSPDGRTAYVTTGRGRKLFALDADTCTEEWSLDVGDRPWGVAVSPDGTKVYTANGSSNDVSVVDVETRRVVARLPVPGRPWGVAIRP